MIPLSSVSRHPSRFRLARAGIHQVWQYDDEFSFGDGRLLLRGKNGAGKSKALEILLPFLLDGDARRIDASGGGKTTLKWLMLDGWSGGTNRHGYLWAEFTRVDDEGEPHRLTVGASVRASASTGEARAEFFVTSLQVGDELPLHDPARRPSRDKARELIGHAHWYERPADYRARVARELFGLTDQARYRNLIHLLYGLRRPTIGDRIESGELVKVLSDALPPLDDDVIDKVARNLDDLDAVRAELARLERTNAALTTFLKSYRGYLHGVLRARVSHVTAALGDLSRKRRQAGDAERTVATLKGQESAAAGVVESLETARATADADLRALRDSAAYGALRDLRDKRQTLHAVAETARTAWDAAGRAHDGEATAAQWLRDETDSIGRDLSDLRAALRTVRRTARGHGLDEGLFPDVGATRTEVLSAPLAERLTGPDGTVVEVARPAAEALSPEISGELEEWRTRLTESDALLKGRLRAAAALDSRLKEVADAERKAGGLREHAERLEGQLSGARERLDGRGDQLVRASRQYAASVASWAARLPHPASLAAMTEMPDDPATPAQDRALGRGVPDAVARTAHETCAPVLSGYEHERDQALERERSLGQELDKARKEKRRWEAQADPEPPRSPYSCADRTTGTGAPLFLLVDFRETVPDTDRPGIEAALEASGLLAAWVSAQGTVLAAGTRDVILRGAAPVAGASLADVLRPVPGHGVSEAALDRLLRGIGLADNAVPAEAVPADAVPPEAVPEDAVPPEAVPADAGAPATVPPDNGRHRAAAGALPGTAPARGGAGAEPAARTWVARDGRYRVDVIRGAHVKGRAEYIGAAVRAATRQRRIDELAARAGELAEELERAVTARQEVERRRDALQAALREIPAGRLLTEAWTGYDNALAEVTRLSGDLLTARREAEQATATAVGLRTRAQAQATGDGLPADREQLSVVQRDLAGLRKDLEGMVAGASRAGSRLARHEAARASWGNARQGRLTAESDYSAARERLAGAQRELELLERSAGATEQEIMAAETDAQRRLDAAERRLPQARTVHGGAHDGRLRAEADRDRLVAELGEQERSVVAGGSALRRPLGLAGLPLAAGLTGAGPLLDRYDAAQDGDVRSRIGALRALADGVGAMLGPVGADVSASLIIRRSEELRDGLAGGYDAEGEEDDGIKRYVLRDDTGTHDVAVVGERIRSAAEAAASRLSAREQEVFETYLLGELGDHLSRQVLAARNLVATMSDTLEQVRSSHGIGVRLDWELPRDGDADIRAAVALLRQPSALRTRDQSAQLRDALRRRIEEARRADPSAGYAVHLRAALDYRDWFEFKVKVTEAAHPDRERLLSHRTALSQGEMRVVSYLVLFATAAAHFTSVAAGAPQAPRLILLDDAFAKVDEPTHGRLLGLLVELDLDFIITSERLWGCFPTVPSLHIYECLRDPAARGVATVHFTWDGHHKHLVGV
jgi:hypothetical protein